jgi:hypothetical protein
MSFMSISQLNHFLFSFYKHLPMPKQENIFVYIKSHLKQSSFFQLCWKKKEIQACVMWATWNKKYDRLLFFHHLGGIVKTKVNLHREKDEKHYGFLSLSPWLLPWRKYLKNKSVLNFLPSPYVRHKATVRLTCRINWKYNVLS